MSRSATRRCSAAAAAVLQFVRIGAGAMIGGVSGVGADVIPFGFAFGPRARLCGLNIIGLQRRGADKAQLHKIRAAFKFMFAGPGTFAARTQQASQTYAGDPYVEKILAFIAAPSRHGLITTLGRSTGEDDA